MVTFRISIGFVRAVAMAPENAPEATFSKILEDPKAHSDTYLDGSYKPIRRPPYVTDLISAGINPRYRARGPSFFNIWVANFP